MIDKKERPEMLEQIRDVNINVGEHKGSYFSNQMLLVFWAFSERPKTMLEVSVETGVRRANICRYVAKWEEDNRIEFIGLALCKVSNWRAGYYQTSLD